MKTIHLDRPKKTRQVASCDSQDNSQKPFPNNSSPNAQKTSLNKTSLNSRYGAPNQKICCCYVNNTAQFQIVRMADPEGTTIGTTSSGLVERTVPPYASILFEANSQDRLEVHTGHLMSSIHSDTIACYQLAHPNLSAYPS